ncbi:MAG: GAF domain-containing protein [Armatimonadetes bacterium]|nr:GAF domain-containing protein [Armatimonadota bacterium]
MNLTKHKSIILEWLILFAIIFIINIIWLPSNLGFTGNTFHPFLLAVILITGRYGMQKGMFTALYSSLLYLVIAILKNIPKFSPFLYPHSLIIVSFFLISLLMGYFLEEERNKAKLNIEKIKTMDEQLKILQAHHEVLEKANKELRSRIMGETSTLESLYEMAQKLTTMESRFLYPAVLELMVNHMGAQMCSFYLLENDKLKLAAQNGWENVPKDAKNINLSNGGILSKAIQEKKIITLKDLAYQEEALKSTDKIMAAPIKSVIDNTILGVLAVEKIPFTKFVPETLKMFSVISDWTSKALSNVSIFSKIEEEKIAAESVMKNLMNNLKKRKLTSQVLESFSSLGEKSIPFLFDALKEQYQDIYSKYNVFLILEKISGQEIMLPIPLILNFIQKEISQAYRLFIDYSALIQIDNKLQAELLSSYLNEQYKMTFQTIFKALDIIVSNKGKFPKNFIFNIIYFSDKINEQDYNTVLEAIKSAIPENLLEAVEALLKKDTAAILRQGNKIGGYEKEEVEAILKRYLNINNKWFKACSIFAIGEMKLNSLKWEVYKYTEDSDEYLRESAFRALSKISPDLEEEKIKQAFLKALEDSNPVIRETAKNMLDAVNGVSLSTG